MVATLITGIVTGFVLVIDPNNEKGKREELHFDDATKMGDRMRSLMRAETEFYKVNPRLNYDPTETQFWTEYKGSDNSATEKEYVYDPSGKTKIGTLAYRGHCKCGKTSWMNFNESNPNPTGEYVCEDCNDVDQSIHDHDFTNYDGTQEREY